jgi:hypothetical protein
MGEVASLWRFAVKGLDRDDLRRVELLPGKGFPNDRRWALQLEHLPPATGDPEMPLPTHFDPLHPKWIHKQCEPNSFAHRRSACITLRQQVLSVCVYCRRGAWVA